MHRDAASCQESHWPSLQTSLPTPDWNPSGVERARERILREAPPPASQGAEPYDVTIVIVLIIIVAEQRYIVRIQTGTFWQDVSSTRY